MALRVTQEFVQVLAARDGEARVTQQFVQVLVAHVTGTVHEPTGSSNTLSLTQSATVTTGTTSALGSNTLVLSHSVLCERIYFADIEHTLTLVSEAAKTTDAVADSTLTLTQDAEFLRAVVIAANNVLSLTSDAAVEAEFVRLIGQGLALTHSAQRSVYYDKELSHSVALTSVASGYIANYATSVLSLSQDATGTTGKRVAQSLVLTSVAYVDAHLVRSMLNGLIPFQSVSVQYTKTVPLTQSLTFTQTAVGQAVKLASQSLTLTQAAVVGQSKPATNALVLVDSAAATVSYNLTAATLLQVLQSSTRVQTKANTPISILGFSQNAKGTLSKPGVVAQTLTLTQAMVREYHLKSATSALALSSAVAGTKLAPRSVTSSLALVHAASVSQTLVRGITHTLTFQGFFQRYAGLVGQTYITVPSLQVVRVRNIVRLQSDSQVIILPAAEFNDREAAMSEINIKRAMNGTRRVYKREVGNNKLVYDFVLDRVKAIELRAFILANNSVPLEMENWRGELWVVNLVNNPFTFSEVARWNDANKCTITLEMEGVKIA